ncbi:MAG TPA: Gfo/Idh/MocA family oxidoreductase, partial [Longimicrobiales bacterium]
MSVTRREFVADAARAAAAAAILPRSAAAAVVTPPKTAPADKLKLAIVGCGGMGMSNARELVGEDIVALCDVDFGYVDKALFNFLRDRETKKKDEQEKLTKLEAAYHSARRYTDFREMLATEKALDGVVVATPDHLHAVVAAAAMKAHKAVYVQKPLTRTVHEARALKELARTTGV